MMSAGNFDKVELADYNVPSTSNQVPPRTTPKRSSLEKLRKQTYLFLEYPSPFLSLVYHIVQCLLCLSLLCLGLVYERPHFKGEGVDQEIGPALVGLEIVLLLWLLPELMLRVWSSGCRKRFQGWRGILAFFSCFLLIIDVTTVLIALAVLVLGVREVEDNGYQLVGLYRPNGSESAEEIWEDNTTHIGFTDLIMPALLFVQIIRLCKFARIFGGSRLFNQVLAEKSRVLLTYSQIGLLGFFIFPYFVYLSEMDSYDSHFRNYADSLWWSIVTLTTVGYGDTRPLSILGRFFGGLTAIFGCLVFFVPAVVVGIGLQQKVKEEKIRKNSPKNPAAVLIQSKWRLRRLGGNRQYNVMRAILLMKFLVAQKKLKETKKGMVKIGNVTSRTKHELICSLDSRMIQMEQSMAKVLDKVGRLGSMQS